MPWDDLEALHDDACDLPADISYVAEEKPKDDYQAPERTAARQVKRPTKKNALAGAQSAQPPTPHGKPNHSHAGRKMLWVLIAAVSLFGMVGGCVSELLDNDVDNSLASDSYDQNSDYSQETANEQEISRAVTDRMDGLSKDPHAAELAAQGLDSKLQSYLGYTAEELGIDTNTYVEWFFSNLSYQVVYAYDYGDGTGSASLDVTSPLVYQIAGDLYDKSADFLMENGLYGSYDDMEAIPLTPEQQDTMRSFFADTLAATAPQNYGSLNVSVNRDASGAWQLDERDFEEQLDYLFGVS